MARFLQQERQKMTVIGTPLYMASEILFEEESGFGVDIWSLGCIMYELMTGRLPYRGSSNEDLLLKLSNSTPNKITGSYSNELKTIIEKMLITNQNIRITPDQILKEPIIVQFKKKQIDLDFAQFPLMISYQYDPTSQDTYSSLYFSYEKPDSIGILQYMTGITFSDYINEISTKYMPQGNLSLAQFLGYASSLSLTTTQNPSFHFYFQSIFDHPN